MGISGKTSDINHISFYEFLHKIKETQYQISDNHKNNPQHCQLFDYKTFVRPLNHQQLYQEQRYCLYQHLLF